MKQISLFILIMISSVLVFSQEPSITATVSSNSVGVNQRFNYEIVTNSNCLITPPNFENFQIVRGPSQSHSSSVQIINGKQTRNTEYRIVYELVAKKEGKFSIEKANMECNGEVYFTSAISIDVSKSTQTNTDKDFFMRLSTNKSAVYEGEPFITTLKYYAKVRPNSIEALDLGDASGVWRQDLKPDRQTFNTVVESVNGVRYYAIILREEVCFAQRSGTVRLEPYYASMTFSQGFFNQFRKETYSNALEIKVKDIPNKNADFNGLVGDFKIDSKLSKTDVAIGEAIDISITIEGKGNLQALGNIELDFPNDFDQFDPEIKEKTNVSSSGIKGSIEYNYVLIPTHHGTYTIPGYTFSYFDLADKKMKTLSTGDFEVNVAKPDGSVDIEEKEITVEEQDIHYINTTTNALFTEDDFFYGGWAYFGLLFAPLLFAVFFVVSKRKKENLSDDEKLKVVQKKAVKVAYTSIGIAKEQITKGENKAALKTMQDTLNNFFKQKLNVGLSDLSQRFIAGKLSLKEIDGDSINSFNTVWNTIEMAQYAPITESNLIKTANDIELLITNLDKKL